MTSDWDMTAAYLANTRYFVAESILTGLLTVRINPRSDLVTGVQTCALPISTLSDGARTFIPGIQDQESLTFTANYTKSDYTTLKALEGAENDYAVWFGATVSNGVATPTGSDGKFLFSGKLSVFVNGGSVNEVVNMTISIAPSTVITLDTST